MSDSPEDCSDRPQSQLLMGLLGTNNPSDVPSVLKFIYHRELTGIGEYLNIFANVWWSTNQRTPKVSHRHLNTDPAAAAEFRLLFSIGRISGRQQAPEAVETELGIQS